MPKALQRYITINPQILGGIPVISGTRIPVSRISQLLIEGYTVSAIRNEYPWVNEEKIQYLIAYLTVAGLDAFNQTQKI